MSNTTLPQATAKNEPARDQYWSEHLVRQKKSGLSMTTYCREHHLNYDRFYYWVRKKKQPAPQLIPIEFKSITADNVTTTPMEPPVLLCTVTLRSGSILAIHDKGVIALVLSALR